jgi:hypothetical protein
MGKVGYDGQLKGARNGGLGKRGMKAETLIVFTRDEEIFFFRLGGQLAGIVPKLDEKFRWARENDQHDAAKNGGKQRRESELGLKESGVSTHFPARGR